MILNSAAFPDPHGERPRLPLRPPLWFLRETPLGAWFFRRNLFARAATPEQRSRIGNQTGGRVFLFLHTDDFWRDYNAMRTRGVSFETEPRQEPYGTVAVFVDLYGNRWDLVERSAGKPG